MNSDQAPSMEQLLVLLLITGHTSIVKTLLKHGANANLVNSERRSALMLAESQGHREAVKLLKAAAKPAGRELTKRVHQAGILKVEASDLKALVN